MLASLLLDQEAEKLAAERRHEADLKRKVEMERKAKLAAEISYQKRWGWREEGKQSYLNLQDAYHNLEMILIPHSLKHSAMIELLKYSQQATAATAAAVTTTEASRRKCIQWKYFSTLLLNEISFFSSHSSSRQKSFIIERKLIVLRQLQQITRMKYILHHQEAQVTLPNHITFDYLPYPIAILPMEASFRSRIPLKPIKLMHLKMLRSSFENVSQKVQSIQDNLQKIALMMTCKSVYHEKPSGCLKCGGLIRQHELMVNAVNRATGAMILVPYQFEVQILEKELADSQALQSKYHQLLTTLQTDIRLNVIYDIQSWWATLLFRRRYEKVEQRRSHSLYYYRIRRLVKMKREIDHWDIWKRSLEDLELEFCDVLTELSEYRLEKTKRIQRIVQKFVNKLIQKYLRNSTGNVLRMRNKERKRLERLISFEIIRKKEKVLTETLRQQIEEKARKMVARTWMCDRYECNKRVFMSEQRYRTHMNIHRLKDGSTMKSREELYKLKLARLQKEENFFDKLHTIHAETLQCLPCLTPQNITLTSSPHTSLDEKQTQFITDLTEKTDPVIHFPRVLPPVTRAHLPSASLKYFRHLKKKKDTESVKEEESQNESHEVNLVEKTKSHEIVIEVGKSEEEKGTELRSRLKETKSLVPQSLGYATKKKAHVFSSQLPPLSPPKQSSSSSSGSPKYYIPPSWLSMPQLSHLSDSIQSNKLVTLELVSHVPFLHLSQSVYHLRDSLFTIGTSPTCDCIVSVDQSHSSLLQTNDPRQICHISSIHSVIYTSLISGEYQQNEHHLTLSRSFTESDQGHAHLRPPRDDFSDYPSLSLLKPTSVTISVVDNHTLWGTYVVTMSGVQKVSTVVTKGYYLQSGDLLCLGLIRNGPKTMSSVDANKAMVVFRVRIE